MFTRNGSIPQHAAPPAPARQINGHADLEAFAVELAVPLAGHQGAIGHLSFRQPTLGDYVDLGPIARTVATNAGDIDGMKIEVIEDGGAIMRWIARLTGQPDAILRTMHPRDFASIRREISRLLREFSEGNESPNEAQSYSASAG